MRFITNQLMLTMFFDVVQNSINIQDRFDDGPLRDETTNNNNLGEDVGEEDQAAAEVRLAQADADSVQRGGDHPARTGVERGNILAAVDNA